MSKKVKYPATCKACNGKGVLVVLMPAQTVLGKPTEIRRICPACEGYGVKR